MKLNWKSCLIACVSLFLLYLAIHYWGSVASFAALFISAAGTLILGAVIAYVVNILMSFYERKIAPNSRNRFWVRCRRPVCMLLSFLTVVVALVLLITMIVPQLGECFDKLVNALPGAVGSLYSWLNDELSLDEFLGELNFTLPATVDEWRALLEKTAGMLVSGVGGVMNAAVTVTTSLVGTVFTFFMALIIAINILLGKEKLSSQFSRLFRRILGDRMMRHCTHVAKVLDSCFHSYIVGQLIEALILGSLCALGMWILRLPYALMIGALIGVFALIPIAGAYIGAAIGSIMIFSVDPIKVIVFLIYLVVLQQIEGNLIYPRTVGSTLHLPGLWVLTAVTVGGALMGILGMLLFVPLTAALYRLLGEWVSHENKPALLERFVALGRAGVKAEAAAAVPAVDALSAERPAAAENTPAEPTAPRQNPAGSKNRSRSRNHHK